ncbi:MAG: transposase [Candidatus Binatia bacterium]
MRVIPPKYSVSTVVGKIKANTSRRIRNEYSWIKKVYWGNEFWSIDSRRCRKEDGRAP